MKRLAHHRIGDVVPGVMTSVIPQYALHLRGIGEKGNAQRYARDLQLICARFGWQTTDQIPSDVIERVRITYPHTSAYRKQLAIIGFIRWASGCFTINEAALAVPLVPPPPRRAGTWTVDTEELILSSLRAPMREVSSHPGMTKRGRSYLLLAAKYDHLRRKFLYGIFLLCLRWAVRRREIVELLVKDWHPSTCTLTITTSSTRRRQSRCFPVDRYTADVLDGVCASRGPEEPLFPAHDGRHLHVEMLGKHVRRFMRQIGLRASLQQCHQYAVRSILERMKGAEQEAFAIIGFARRSQARVYECRGEVTASERLRAQAVFDEIACHFRTPEKSGHAPHGVAAGYSDIPDFAELIRPLLTSLNSNSENSSESAAP